MATDPNTPNTSLPEVPTDISETTQKIQIWTNSMRQASEVSDQLNGNLNKVSVGIDLLETVVSKTTVSFSDFNKNIGTLNINPFSKTLETLGNQSELAINTLGKLSSAFGFEGTTSNFLKEKGSELIQAADNAAHFESGILGVAGATGQMNDVLSISGEHFENLNSVLNKYNEQMGDVAIATNTDLNVVAKSWEELSLAVPKAANLMTTTIGSSGQAISNLQATMDLAAGTGRSYDAVLGDITSAYEDYGLEGQEALDFTSQISDLTEKFGTRLADTESFIKKNADAFKLISRGADDSGKAFQGMFKAFSEGAGLSPRESINMIGELTAQMGKLTTAQKAFLSAQTGGPGGLRGAYQIDEMLRKGQVSEVLGKVEQSLKKQFGGKIYTQEEASKSDFAAAQFTRQRSLLQSGAFGNLVGTGPEGDAKAARLLEAFASGGSAKNVLQAPTTTTQDFVNRGRDIRNQSTTELSQKEISYQVESNYRAIDIQDIIKKNLTNSVRNDRTTDFSIQSKENIDRGQQNPELRSENILNTDNKFLKVDTIKERLSLLPVTIQKLISKITDELLSTDVKVNKKGSEDLSKAYAKLESDQKNIENKINKQGGKATEKQTSELANIKNSENFIRDLSVTQGAVIPQKVLAPPSVPQNQINSTLNTNIRNSANNQQNTQRPTQQEVVVRVQGVFCEKCHSPIQTDNHSVMVTSGANNIGR